MSCIYKPDFIKNNVQGIASAAINEICEKCDSDNLKDPIQEMLMTILQELAESTTTGYHLKLKKEKMEDF